MHDEHKPLISRFPCYVEAEGRSGERDGIRHARECFFFAGDLEIAREFCSLFDLTIGQCRRLPTSSIRRLRKIPKPTLEASC